MRLSSAIIVSLLNVHLGVFAYPDVLPSPPVAIESQYALHRRSSDLAAAVSREADKVLNGLHRRQASSSSPSPPAPSATAPSSNDTRIESELWEAQTTMACEKAIKALNGRSTSDSGFAVCHNLPSLDNSTGRFEGDLRLYRVSPPQGVWAEVSEQDFVIGLSYVGAVVSENRGVRMGQEPAPTSLAKRQDQAPQLLQSARYVGQLNETSLTTPMNLTQLVALLSPNITLTANLSIGDTISTTFTPKEAFFVNGVFAGSPLGAASANLNRPAPFVLPGTRLEIFPVGLVITVSWAALGIVVVAWGTYERYQYRQHYRRRKMRERMTVRTF